MLVDIDLGALRQNARLLKQRLGRSRALFVLKKDAYGHGAIACGRVLEEEQTGYFAVTTVEEGIELRRAGLHTPILVFALSSAEEAALAVEASLSLTITDPATAAIAAQAAESRGRKAKVHLKIDTGMGRLGYPAEDQRATVAAIRDSPWLDFEGVYLHLASADSDEPQTEDQARRFSALLASLDPRPPLCHLTNSAGARLAVCEYDMARIGIALYGGLDLYPETEPVMTARSRLIQVRQFHPGQTISYGATYKVSQPMPVGIVCVGYGDGVLRSLSNRGTVLIRGREAPIAGRVCMDQFMVDLSGVRDARPGDEVLLFGRSDAAIRPVWHFAEQAGTISYELTTLIGRLARDRQWIDGEALGTPVS